VANLSSVDKRILEELLGMSGGYVLDFTNATFQDFFKDFDINIYAKKYALYGDSKGKRLRAFLQVEEDILVGRVLNALLEYVSAIKPAEAGGAVEEKHYAIVKKLLGDSPISKVTKTEDFLQHDFGQLDLASLGLQPEIEKVIQQRLAEIKSCINAKAWLSVIFLSGSTMEGLLLNAAMRNPARFNRAKAAPKDEGNKIRAFPSWTLNDLINVSYELGLIGLDVKKHAHALRDFRNYIHPYQQSSSDFFPDEHTGKIAWQVLRAVVAGLTGKRESR